MNKLERKNPDSMRGDFVIFKNPSTWPFVDRTPRGKVFRLAPGREAIIPKTLAIWFIGDYESPFWKDGPGTAAEIKAIYSRNRYHTIFCRVIGSAPEESKPIIEETVEEPQERLNEMAKMPDKVNVSFDHLAKKPSSDPNRIGGSGFRT